MCNALAIAAKSGSREIAANSHILAANESYILLFAQQEE
jgi:hypothetical protein